ncbi:MAG: glycosyl transferase family protein [Acidobacteria bacterium]|nr:glycosyl transferase family protein [Acidobacteriota bacterium]
MTYLETCLALLAIWVVVSGLDDLFINAAWLWGLALRRLEPSAPLSASCGRRIAILVPLWREGEVIGKMLGHNLAAIRYPNYAVFAGAYPNDADTLAALGRVTGVHLVLCPHPGPTSKADCLNWLYRGMLAHEQTTGEHFGAVVLHDAEDVIHPEELASMDRHLDACDMVQIPVLPLPLPPACWTHGVYCDDFAEFHSKDLPVRQMLGGFIPGAGVGVGFSREALEKLAARSGRPFDPDCLTEDYETGFRIHGLGRRQLFLAPRVSEGRLLATRGVFPRDFTAAVRQRARWTIGIALQSWERHGWGRGAGQVYWFWRDRKAILGNLLSPVANLLFLQLLFSGEPSWILLVPASQVALRTWCAARIYGWIFALGVPLRSIWGNWINGAATVCALWRYGRARLRREPLRWIKTEHTFPEVEGV